MQRFSWRDRLRYRFDDMMSRGPLISLVWLAAGALIFIVVLTLLIRVLDLAPHHDDNTPATLYEILWFTVLQTLNANLNFGSLRESGFMVATTAATIAGLLLIGSLIGILTNGIQARLERLRKGRSIVVEHDHIVILGWSGTIFTVLSELICAREHGHDCIAILANQDKVFMEDEIRDHVPHTGHTRIVCRTGEPTDLHDLAIVNPHGARAVIVLSPDDENPDAHVVKTILALTKHPERRADRFHIVAQLHDPQNCRAAKIVGGNEAQLVVAQDLIAHVIVQTLRQSGLSLVYSELLDFEGDEIYFQLEPRLFGNSFGAALLAYDDSAVIGLRTAAGTILLNPPAATRIENGDQIIAISQDDDTVVLNGRADPEIDEAAIQPESRRLVQPKRVLVLGWNHWAPHVLRELDHFVAPGSLVRVVADDPAVEKELLRASAELVNQQLSFELGTPGDRAVLDRLAIPTYQHVLTLSDVDRLTPVQADAHMLVTLLHLREIGEQCGHAFSIVSEMLEEHTRQLAEVTRADDFIVSNKLVSLMLAQLAENREMAAVFDNLFDANGAAIYVKPVTDYVSAHRPVNFYTLVEAARRRGEIAIGYRVQADSTDAGRGYGIRLNPPKAERLSFTQSDRLIVLA